MFSSRPTTPFIPPHPDALPAVNESARVIPTSPPAAANAYVYPQGAAWPPAGAFGYAPQHPARGRRNSRVGYEGMPAGGGPPMDPSMYFGMPAHAYATPAAHHGALGVMTGDPWSDSSFLTPSYGGGGGPVIPPRPTHSRSRSRSRGSHGAWPDDWIGPRSPDEGYAMPATMPVPPEFASRLPPGTPFYAPPGMVPGTAYSGFYPLPHHAYGHPRPFTRSAHNTPWRGGGYELPTPGGADEALRDPYDRAERPEQSVGMVNTRWFTGAHYGPVLDPLLAAIVKCSFKINPLLAPPPDDPSKRAYLTWNMLFSSAYVHRSDERAQQSWLGGRDSPATHPRLTQLRLISRRFPWFVEVRAASRTTGVTCGELIDTLSNFLLARTSGKEFEALTKTEQMRVGEAYHHNRSMADDVPGGRLGQGLRRCDFLAEETMWGGIEVDQKYVAERMAIGGRPRREMTAVFVLNCETRLPMTDEERRAEASRGARSSE